MQSEAHSRNAELMRQAEAYWTERGSRITTVRRIICRTLFEQSDAIDAETLLRLARKTDKLISLSTVYRTLSGLVKAGILVEIEGRDGKKNYNVANAATNASTHIVCKDCGHVFPVENPCLSLRESAVARSAGFQPSKISLRFEADCESLKQKGTCDNCRKPDPSSET